MIKAIKVLSLVFMFTILTLSSTSFTYAKTSSAGISFYIAEEDLGLQVKHDESNQSYIQNFENIDFEIQEYDKNDSFVRTIDPKVENKIYIDFKPNNKYVIIVGP